MELEKAFNHFIRRVNNNPETSNYIFKEDDDAVAEFKQALTEWRDREVAEARIDENRMGLNWHIAVKNGLEQQSENAQLTATWKANEQIILEFKTRLAALKPSKETAEDE